MALFAYMALSGNGTFHAREKLCGMFWPESSEDRARLSLRQALHFLRGAGGSDLIASRLGDEIGIRADAVRSDVSEFETAIAEQRPADALALYRGTFLQDFRITGVAPDFELWLDSERARLLGLAVSAAKQLTDLAARDGDIDLAVRSARVVTRLSPFDEPAFRRLVTLLDRAGDRASALQEYSAFTDRLARELESPPSPETQELVERLRTSNGNVHVRRTVPRLVQSAPAAASAGDHAPNETIAPQRRPQLAWRRASVLALVPLAILTSLVLTTRRSRVPASPVVLAVGMIRSQARDTLLGPGIVRELLASDLARIEGVDVVSGERMQELIVQLTPSSDTAAAIANAARRAGASQVLEGILSGGGGSPLRFDVRRADLADGTIHGALVIEAPDIFSLADQLSAQVAGQLRRSFPQQPIADLRSGSLVARRLYEEGARVFYHAEPAAALRLFDAALREDSTFTMAALFAAQAAWRSVGDSVAMRYLGLARRAARRSTDRERLLVETEWARRTNSPNAVAVAESLATRYPSEPVGEYALGDALAWTGERERAFPHLRLAIDHDSTSLSATSARGVVDHLWCRACDAFARLVEVEMESDSLYAAERTTREWIRRRPGDWVPRATLSNVYENAGRLEEARAAYGESARLLGHDPDPLFRVRLALRGGSFASADRALEDQLTSGAPGVRAGALWWLLISLRQQGRLHDALDRADDLIREEETAPGPHEAGSLGHIGRAQIMFELGRVREAAGLFETIAAAPIVSTGILPAPGQSARRRAWMLTHAATAYAAAGDTTRLVRLADTVEQVARNEANGRDRRLHHYIRALLLEARRDWTGAERELRLATSSPNLGFTRINLELSRTLLAQGRPRDAVPVLQSALRGGFEGSNFYITGAELHESLGRAFAAAGERDSARAHNALLAAAWHSGDAPFRLRASRARDEHGEQHP
jgi:DNA-binding SARP family transcriptional activator/tetratricopeptide (TPR) repeat protein